MQGVDMVTLMSQRHADMLQCLMDLKYNNNNTVRRVREPVGAESGHGHSYVSTPCEHASTPHGSETTTTTL